MAPRVINPGASWRQVVKFMHRPLCPRGKTCRFLFERRLLGIRRGTGWGGEKKKAPAGNRTPVVQPVAPI